MSDVGTKLHGRTLNALDVHTQRLTRANKSTLSMAKRDCKRKRRISSATVFGGIKDSTYSPHVQTVDASPTPVLSPDFEKFCGTVSASQAEKNS